MKKHSFIFTIFSSFVLCALCPSNTIDAAQVYAVLVGDSHQSTTFYDMENNLDMMQREAKRIAACNCLPLKIAVFEGFEARSENLLRYLEAMNVDSGDIVLFYASVHGTRSKNKSNRWPDLGFTLDEIFNPTKMTIDFNLIHDILKAKNPQFLLSIADSCNSIHDLKHSIESDKDWEDFFDEGNDSEDDDEEEVLFEGESIFDHLNPQGPTIEYQMSANDPALIFNRLIEESEFFRAYHVLFKQPGSVIVSSSSPGEEAFGGFNSFTPKFLQILNESANDVSLNKLNWELILRKVQKGVAKESQKPLRYHQNVINENNDLQTQQTVQYEIDLKI